MKRYGVRDLRQNASMLLRQVAAGETIEITNNGQPVAQLIPAAAGDVASPPAHRRSPQRHLTRRR
jgi:prevent-host-death family protein